MQNSTQHTVLFPELFSKPIHVAFCHEELSSNGGTVLLCSEAMGQRTEQVSI